MKKLTGRGDEEVFFRQLRGAQRPFLLLDYDGTLAPFQVNRHEAYPAPGVRERIQTIVSETPTSIRIISGRIAEELTPLLAVSPMPIIHGAHGWEELHPGGAPIAIAPEPAEAMALERAWLWVQQLGYTGRAERKAASVTIHWRDLNVQKSAEVRSRAHGAWQSLLVRGLKLELHDFDGGLEFCCTGRNKGTVCAEILTEYQPDAVAFLGDDRTDEDAFAALADYPGALSVLVRKHQRESMADLWISPDEGELLHFLDRWIDSTRKC